MRAMRIIQDHKTLKLRRADWEPGRVLVVSFATIDMEELPDESIGTKEEGMRMLSRDDWEIVE